MMDIIGRIQELNASFQHSIENSLSLQQFCEQLCKILHANIYFFYADGEIFCYATSPDYHCRHTDRSLVERQLPSKYKTFFDDVQHSAFNVYEEFPGCTCEDVDKCIYSERYFSIVPIYYNALRATKAGMLMIRYGSPFAQEEEILCEYTAIVVALELFYRAQDSIKQDAMQIAYSQLAVNSLSASELTAAKVILDQIDGEEGIVMLVKAAAQAFVTQSVASSALKKLESAGVISTQSFGVKGKHIKINNQYLREEVSARAERQPK
jgi:transcriptional pleiotropic repressor